MMILCLQNEKYRSSQNVVKKGSQNTCEFKLLEKPPSRLLTTLFLRSTICRLLLCWCPLVCPLIFLSSQVQPSHLHLPECSVSNLLTHRTTRVTSCTSVHGALVCPLILISSSYRSISSSNVLFQNLPP